MAFQQDIGWVQRPTGRNLKDIEKLLNEALFKKKKESPSKFLVLIKQSQ